MITKKIVFTNICENYDFCSSAKFRWSNMFGKPDSVGVSTIQNNRFWNEFWFLWVCKGLWLCDQYPWGLSLFGLYSHEKLGIPPSPTNNPNDKLTKYLKGTCLCQNTLVIKKSINTCLTFWFSTSFFLRFIHWKNLAK